MEITIVGTKATVKFDYSSFEACGSNTLIGKLATFLKTSSGKLEVELSFKEANKLELEKNKGPEIVIMPSYVPCYIINDVIWLIQNNISVTTSFYKEY